MEHAEDVVIWDDEQIRGRAKGRVLIGQQMRADVAVGLMMGKFATDSYRSRATRFWLGSGSK